MQGDSAEECPFAECSMGRDLAAGALGSGLVLAAMVLTVLSLWGLKIFL